MIERPGYLTAKAISNRMKARGLQKLRWYCQMCQKQCRDENGFKCHTNSESHQRQLMIVSEQPERFINDFSREFHRGFMSTVRRIYGTRRVEANTAYQEYIRDRHHIHMNGTRWTTLTGYVQFLGNTGQCIVDQCEDKWYIQAIPNDPEHILNSERTLRRDRTRLNDSERERRYIQKQMELDRKRLEDKGIGARVEEVKEFCGSANIHLKLAKKRNSDFALMPSISLEEDKRAKKEKNIESVRRSALDDIIADEEHKRRRERRLVWLTKGIVVKIVDADDGNYPEFNSVIRIR
ncbi:hypothetical protein ACOME3_005860 [Neoechinorhynchus agilis]